GPLAPLASRSAGPGYGRGAQRDCRGIWQVRGLQTLRKGRSMSVPTDYDTIAERYAAGIDERPWNVLYERPATLALLPDVAGKQVLDAGCGHGWYADWLVRNGASVVAVDRSPSMVALARQRLGGRARVLRGDVSDLRGLLADAAFDLIVSSLVLHY